MLNVSLVFNCDQCIITYIVRPQVHPTTLVVCPNYSLPLLQYVPTLLDFFGEIMNGSQTTVRYFLSCMADKSNHTKVFISQCISHITISNLYRVRNLKFARNLTFATSKTLVNFMKKMICLSNNWYFSVHKALIYYTVNKSHHN